MDCSELAKMRQPRHRWRTDLPFDAYTARVSCITLDFNEEHHNPDRFVPERTRLSIRGAAAV